MLTEKKESRLSLFLLVLLVLLAGCSTTKPNPTKKATDWIVTYRNQDGGYTSFSTGKDVAASDAGGTVDALMGLTPAGYQGMESAEINYLTAHNADLETYAKGSGGAAGKTVLALVASEEDPTNFGGVNYVAILVEKFNSQDGSADATPFAHSLAMLGLAAAQRPIPSAAIIYLQSKQSPNGGWDDGYGTDDNPDATGAALMALVASGVPSEDGSIIGGVELLKKGQLESGGWEYSPGAGESPNSTAFAIQGLLAAGEEVSEGLAALQRYQSETGAFQVDLGQGLADDFYATIQSLPALAQHPFPYTVDKK